MTAPELPIPIIDGEPYPPYRVAQLTNDGRQDLLDRVYAKYADRPAPFNSDSDMSSEDDALRSVLVMFGAKKR